MNSFRCVGMLLVLVLSACDAQKTPAPEPKAVAEVNADVQAAAVAPVAAVVVAPDPVAAPVHDLMPNVPVVPVMVAQGHSPSSSKASVKSAAPKSTADKAVTSKKLPVKPRTEATTTAKRDAVSSKTKAASEAIKQVRIPKTNLDLTLPTEMVKQLTPPGSVPPPVHKPLIPEMFSSKKSPSDSSFQLNGRLLSNEMQLPMRENKREVEGAALDFEFKQ